MSIAAFLVPLAAGHEEVPNPLPIPAVWFGILAMVAFLGLLGLTWSFRNTGAKAEQLKARRDAADTAGAHGGGHH